MANRVTRISSALKPTNEQANPPQSMDVTQLPFNRLIGLEECEPESGFLVALPDGPQYANHLGAIHASALLAVAEAGSGVFLVRRFDAAEGYVPVVRRLEAKFRKAAQGRVFARCTIPDEEVCRWSEKLASSGRVLAPVSVEVIDSSGVIVLSAVVEWFIARGGSEVNA